MRVISLFAGIGGFDLGFTRAGMQIVACVEKDLNCRKLLSSKFKDSVIFDDVKSVGRDNLPECDVLCGGFPCQDMSMSGKRGGFKGGSRSGLFYEMSRIASEIKPKYIVWENVLGLLTSDKGRDFARVLVEMDRIGYRHGAWRIFDSKWFGVAQSRRRVFGVFTHESLGAETGEEILSVSESMRLCDQGSRKEKEVLYETDAKCNTGRCEKSGESDNPVMAFNWQAGGNYPIVIRKDLVGTLVCSQVQAVLVPKDDGYDDLRKLTVLECERLQGFEDGWTEGFLDGVRYRMLGNAVSVPVIEWIGKRIMAKGVVCH
jgi:DNA (cytosine-5)-methyltransferase 1